MVWEYMKEMEEYIIFQYRGRTITSMLHRAKSTRFGMAIVTGTFDLTFPFKADFVMMMNLYAVVGYQPGGTLPCGESGRRKGGGRPLWGKVRW